MPVCVFEFQQQKKRFRIPLWITFVMLIVLGDDIGVYVDENNLYAVKQNTFAF